MMSWLVPKASPNEAHEALADPDPRDVARFHVLYRDHFDFVFRNLRRLGVHSAQLDDAVQDTFMVALRHIDKYVDGSSGKAWLFAISLRVARNFRRGQIRKDSRLVSIRESATNSPAIHPDPFEQAAKAQAVRVLHAFLEDLDEDKRAAFIMTELEQMSAPEISEALGLNLNTVYARIRAARREFTRAVEALAREERPRS
jgi:RNA polymerase sigma-70 factor (ECF subfamily)